MQISLEGIDNVNEYYTNHYFATLFGDNAHETVVKLDAEAKRTGEKTPWSQLRNLARQYNVIHDRYIRHSLSVQTLQDIKAMADNYLQIFGYPKAEEFSVRLDEHTEVPVYLALNKANGAPLLWVLLAASDEKDSPILERSVFSGVKAEEQEGSSVSEGVLSERPCEELVNQIFFGQDEAPRFLILVGIDQIALLDRNKWNAKRYLQFNLDDIFGRREESTLKAVSVLLHKSSLCPEEGRTVLDEFDENSQRNASGVSQDLKYALRESIELLGNEVLYDLKNRQHRDLRTNPVDASELTLQCLRYMYRMLFVLFIESRQDLGYAPMKSLTYFSGYSLESLRDIADHVRASVDGVGSGYYLFESLEKLYALIYQGYPTTEEGQQQLENDSSKYDVFQLSPLKAHIFDPERTALITHAKIRDKVMLQIIDLMSLTRDNGKKGGRGRISYSNLGINQMGAVYEALLSYRGFIAEQDLYEVKPAGSKFDPLEVGYFVPESELGQYTEDERVYETDASGRKQLKVHREGTFVYRLAGREREKSASYYTPESLTKCLVKYALKELLKDKKADEILNLKICEPAMGSAAFLNETINQLAEAYIDRKQKELGETLSYERRPRELQKVKMYIADRCVYGIDLNPTAVELAEVSLWLNTIFDGSFVPWFGTQLVNGNSLIGARRECYTVGQLTATSKGMRWYENAPERVLLGTKRKDYGYKSARSQIYHFLVGDPGMANYDDKVIKSLTTENIKKLKEWNKTFTSPYIDDEKNDPDGNHPNEDALKTLLNLSKIVDNLWEKQIKNRKELEERTRDKLNIYGHQDNVKDSHNSIREKDKIYRESYKSEEQRNAGPYARLRFAMDYWCALWFWPIDQVDLLPSRSEFLFDMSLILDGTLDNTVSGSKAISLFPTKNEEIIHDTNLLYKDEKVVDIPALCKKNPRLALAHRIAKEQRFMHWELEFADLFAEKGGFDLVIGNPPWVKLTWKEEGVLADNNPLFAVKKLTARETTDLRNNALKVSSVRKAYYSEYESITGSQNFMNSVQNYAVLSGQQTNLYKCFLPQAWNFANKQGVVSFVHPDGVYDDPKAGLLRKEIYKRLRSHFQFTNEYKLFEGVDHHTSFSLNIYSNKLNGNFDSIGNLFAVSTIDQCYDGTSKNIIPGIKDSKGMWNTEGHPERIVRIGKNELMTFAKLFDGNEYWENARLPIVHANSLLEVIKCFNVPKKTVGSLENHAISSVMWDETNAQKAGIIKRDVHFPNKKNELIYSGPHIGVANPLFKSSRRICKLNSDYDSVDLIEVGPSYLPRCNYSLNTDKIFSGLQKTVNDARYVNSYRLCLRKMLGQSGVRTLIGAIIPPEVGHINGLIGFALEKNFLLFASELISIPFDFYAKLSGKANLYASSVLNMPIIPERDYNEEAICRCLMLNCLTDAYSELWTREYKKSFNRELWTKIDSRLLNSKFSTLGKKWNQAIPLRTDYERRQALVEIDVLIAKGLGMTLEQLKDIYRIQFPILQQYEADTWYDANGRIVFTNNRSLVNVGFNRKEWEDDIKGAPAGKKFYRKIIDDTMPGGPVERTIEYVAPFDRCDREKDYETAWKFFEEKYGK
jgi:type I restriction-modification system DNA methylase subunit